MSFHIDFPAFLSTLPVMLYGMIGGMVVMGIICLALMAMYAIGRRKGKRNKEA